MSESRASRLRSLTYVELALGLALLGLFMAFRDLPLVDLPQHAWQLASWQRIDAGDPRVADLELHFRTPYLLAYPVARLLAEVMPVLPALKLTLALSIALQARALRFLCARLGHDPWLGLLGYPLGLGYGFCFGFVSYCAALPLVYLAVALTLAHRERPKLTSGLWLAVTAAALLVAHGVALGFTFLVLSPVLLTGGGRLWQRLCPLLAVPALALVWLVPAGSATRYGGDDYRLQAWRWLELPGQLVGIGSADAVGTLGGLALLVVVGLHCGRLASSALALPLAITLLGYGLFPTMFRGAGTLWPRFVTLLVPAVLVAFTPRAVAGRWLGARRASVLVVVTGVLATFGLRLPAYQAEASEMRRLIEDLPAGLELRPIVFERGGYAFPGTPAHLHTPAYYAAERGGHAGYSFAMYSISVVQFRPGTPIKMGGGAEWTPEAFAAAREANDYDYFLVRSLEDRSSSLFPGPEPHAVLDARDGWWWRYRRSREP